MSIEKLRGRMEELASQVKSMNLLPAKNPIVFRDKGGLVMKGVRYSKNWYVAYTTTGNHSVSLDLLQPGSDPASAYVVVRRRKPDGKVRMPEVSVDRLPLDKFELAARQFLAVAAVIGDPDTEYPPEYPGELD